MKVLVPIAGATPFFPPEEFPFSKPLVEIDDQPMIKWAVDNLRTLGRDIEFIFVAMQEEATKYSYDGIFELVTDHRCKIVHLSNRTAGSLCSCLMAIEHIDMDGPLIIANYDQIIDGELHDLVTRFEKEDADAGVLTFSATHPRWSYVKTEGNCVIEASEKRVISRKAVAGLYWFKFGRDFVEAAKNSLRAADCWEGDYYVISTLNHLVLDGKRVIAIPMRNNSRLHSFHLPERVHAYTQEIQLAASAGHDDSKRDMEINIVIPAAGLGSRFAKAGYSAPKPFIDVLGRPMLTHVLDNIEVRNAHFTVLLPSQHLGHHDEAEEVLRERGATIIPVAALTEGTACTVLLARKYFDGNAPLLIANSDQLVNFDCQDFVDDARRRNLDGSILVFRDEKRDPKWSFAALDEQGYVTEVAEKKAISDLATVGIYYFSSGSAFIRAAIDMIALNERVNNEFYTCPVYNHMIEAGAKIGVYEVPMGAMTGLGTPEDLQDFITRMEGPGARSRHAPADAIS